MCFFVACSALLQAILSTVRSRVVRHGQVTGESGWGMVGTIGDGMTLLWVRGMELTFHLSKNHQKLHGEITEILAIPREVQDHFHISPRGNVTLLAQQ